MTAVLTALKQVLTINYNIKSTIANLIIQLEIDSLAAHGVYTFACGKFTADGQIFAHYFERSGATTLP